MLSPNELRDHVFSWRPVSKGPSQTQEPKEPSSSMTHDVLWPSIRGVHSYEITVQLEDRRNPDGSEAGDTCCRTWPGTCRTSSSVVSALGLARFRISALLRLPRGSPALASVLQVLALLFLQGRSPLFNLSHIAFSSAVSFGDVSCNAASARLLAAMMKRSVLSTPSNPMSLKRTTVAM